MRLLLAVLLTSGLVVLTTPTLEAGRLDGQEEHAGEGNQTLETNQTATNVTGPALVPSNITYSRDVVVFLTDERLYGFAKPREAPRRLGNQFDLYVIPLNGSIDYRLLVDGEPVRLNGGGTTGRATNVTVEHLSVPNLRRAHLEVELIRENGTERLDYGFVRLRTLADLAEDADDDEIEDEIKRQLRVFTSGEFTWYTFKVGAISLAAILIGIFAGVNRAREAEESEQSYVVGY